MFIYIPPELGLQSFEEIHLMTVMSHYLPNTQIEELRFRVSGWSRGSLWRRPNQLVRSTLRDAFFFYHIFPSDEMPTTSDLWVSRSHFQEMWKKRADGRPLAAGRRRRTKPVMAVTTTTQGKNGCQRAESLCDLTVAVKRGPPDEWTLTAVRSRAVGFQTNVHYPVVYLWVGTLVYSRVELVTESNTVDPYVYTSPRGKKGKWIVK